MMYLYLTKLWLTIRVVISYNEVMGHQLVKLENEDTVQDRNTDDDIPASIIMNSKAKPEEQGRSSHDKLRKPTSHSSVKDRRLSSEDDSYSSRNVRKQKENVRHLFRLSFPMNSVDNSISQFLLLDRVDHVLTVALRWYHSVIDLTKASVHLPSTNPF